MKTMDEYFNIKPIMPKVYYMHDPCTGSFAPKDSPIYFLHDLRTDTIIVGTRGVSEYKIPLRDFTREFLRKRIDLLEGDIQLKEVLKIAIELSQCIDFEEIKDEPKQICGKSIL